MEVGVCGFEKEPPGAGPSSSLLGQNSACDPEKPWKGGVHLSDVPARGLESYQECLGDKISNIIGVGAATNPVQGDRGYMPSKEHSKCIGVPIGRSCQQGSVGAIQDCSVPPVWRCSLKNVTTRSNVLPKPTFHYESKPRDGSDERF